MNIYDIAREAGVSIATISRVVNNSKAVSPEVRKRVEESLARHNYSPNAMARGLVHNSMRTIGVLVVDIRHYLHAALCFTIEKELCGHGYNVILCNTGGDLDAKIKYIKMLSEKKVDGIVLIGSIFSEKEIEDTLFNYLRTVPVIVTNSSLSMENAYSIAGNPVQALELSVAHLYERGHRDICFVREYETYSAAQKLKGFRASMRRRGLKCGDGNVLRGTTGFEGGGMAVEALLKSRRKATALIFEEDTAAIGAVRELRNRGVSVPGDVAIVGYDNTVYGQYCIPSLTTVDTHKDRIATLAADALFAILNKKEVAKKTVIQPTLVVRESA